MYSFVVKMKYDPADRPEVEAAMLKMLAPTHAEPGCVSYIAHWMKDEPATLAIYEQYVDEAAFKYHCSTPEFKQWVEGVLVRLRKEVTFEHMDMIGE